MGLAKRKSKSAQPSASPFEMMDFTASATADGSFKGLKQMKGSRKGSRFLLQEPLQNHAKKQKSAEQSASPFEMLETAMFTAGDDVSKGLSHMSDKLKKGRLR